jgi:diketogulonate reductase-like aldo/keto reductase
VLIHWPGLFMSSECDQFISAEFNEQKRWEMWQGLERAQREGLCVSIGVSNFMVHQFYRAVVHTYH